MVGEVSVLPFPANTKLLYSSSCPFIELKQKVKIPMYNAACFDNSKHRYELWDIERICNFVKHTCGFAISF